MWASLWNRRYRRVVSPTGVGYAPGERAERGCTTTRSTTRNFGKFQLSIFGKCRCCWSSCSLTPRSRLAFVGEGTTDKMNHVAQPAGTPPAVALTNRGADPEFIASNAHPFILACRTLLRPRAVPGNNVAVRASTVAGLLGRYFLVTSSPCARAASKVARIATPSQACRRRTAGRKHPCGPPAAS